MLSRKIEIQTPVKGTISIFRDENGVVSFKDSSGNFGVADGYHGVLLIKNPTFYSWNNLTGEILKVEKFTKEEFIFSLCSIPAVIGGSGGGHKRSGAQGPTGPTGPNGLGIQSLTTDQRTALTPTSALIVEDTDLDEYFKWSTVTNEWSSF